MTTSFRLGRIAGVEVGANWSVLVIFVLIVLALATGRFPASYPGYPSWAYAVAAVAAAVVFLLGLLAHELAHAVVAVRNGLPVEGITLWMLGGVSRLRGEARSPGAELRIAGAGPLASVLIGAGFGLVATALGLAGRTGLVFGTFVWLAGINVVLAVFNALPAAPLDGGRLLRAALWKWRGDRVRAAVAAARAGRFFGVALIVFGLWQFVAGGGIGALWFAFIGWFLFTAAATEERQARMGGALDGVRVRDVMSPEPVTAPADLSVADFVDRYVWTVRHSAFPLVEDDRPVGMVTVNRIRGVRPGDRLATRLRDVACPMDQLAVARPDEPIMEVLPRLEECPDGRALVVGEGHLVGIVSPSDISRAVQRASVTGARPAGH